MPRSCGAPPRLRAASRRRPADRRTSRPPRMPATSRLVRRADLPDEAIAEFERCTTQLREMLRIHRSATLGAVANGTLTADSCPPSRRGGSQPRGVVAARLAFGDPSHRSRLARFQAKKWIPVRVKKRVKQESGAPFRSHRKGSRSRPCGSGSSHSPCCRRPARHRTRRRRAIEFRARELAGADGAAGRAFDLRQHRALHVGDAIGIVDRRHHAHRIGIEIVERVFRGPNRRGRSSAVHHSRVPSVIQITQLIMVIAITDHGLERDQASSQPISHRDECQRSTPCPA